MLLSFSLPYFLPCISLFPFPLVCSIPFYKRRHTNTLIKRRGEREREKDILLVAILDVHGQEDTSKHNAARRKDGNGHKKRQADTRRQNATKGAIHGRREASYAIVVLVAVACFLGRLVE